MRVCWLAAFCAALLGVDAACAFEFSQAGYWRSEGSPRRVERINLGWEFSLDGLKTVKRVSLPHCIDEGELGFAASGGVNRRQKAWYRRTFDWTRAGDRQFLHFEAIMGKCRIALNGKSVAEHFGGFLPVHAEVTDVLREGTNVLEVECDNTDDPTYPPGKPQNQLDFAYFGGIYRDAYLIETGPAYVTDSGEGGVYVSSRLEGDGSWTVFADTAVGGAREGASIEYLYDGERVVPPFRLRAPKVWSPESPNLHRLTVRVLRNGVLSDAVDVRFGIRDFTITTDGLTLNGKPYPRKLVGVNRHQDYLFVGAALANSLHWRDVRKYKDAGLEIFRNAHYPQDPAFMDACDALGMFVIVNTPGWQFWNAEDPVFERRVYDDIEKMVRRDRSRPSVLMWEPVLNETKFPARFVTNAVALVKRETRAPNPCVCDGVASGADVCDVNYGQPTDPCGGPTFCREWGDFPDDWNAQNSSSRVAWEWGEGPMAAQTWHYLHERAWPSLDQILAGPKAFLGGTLWHGADHARGYHPENFLGGILTYGRQKKYSYYAFKAALTKEPFVFVAHELAPFSPSELLVYSNCAYSATYLGKPFEPGKTSFAYADLQKCTYESPETSQMAELTVTLPDGTVQVKRPAKRLAKLVMAADYEGLPAEADGCDLLAVTATLADAAGTPKRYAAERVRFSVSGPAEIVGENPQLTRWGEAIVLLRFLPCDRPEPVEVTAELERKGPCLDGVKGGMVLTPGSCEVRAMAFESKGTDEALEDVHCMQKEFNHKEKEQ